MSEEKRPEWMSSISGIVNPDDYLLGRKYDKTYELYQEEKAQRAKQDREDLIASDKLKLAGDPILELERRKQQLKYEIISNPIRLRQFRERLLKEERYKKGLASDASPSTSDVIRGRKSPTSSSSKTTHYATGSQSRKRSPESPRRKDSPRSHSPDLKERSSRPTTSHRKKYSTPPSSRRRRSSSSSSSSHTSTRRRSPARYSSRRRTSPSSSYRRRHSPDSRSHPKDSRYRHKSPRTSSRRFDGRKPSSHSKD